MKTIKYIKALYYTWRASRCINNSEDLLEKSGVLLRRAKESKDKAREYTYKALTLSEEMKQDES